MIEIWEKSVIPLISCQHNATIYPLFVQLVGTMSKFDPELPKKTLRVALHHWPESRPSKQISYFQLLDALIEKLPADDFEQMCPKIFNLYSRCALSSQHAKVIETSFKIWQNVSILQMMMDNTRSIFPILYPTYQKVMKEHWKGGTQDAALNAIKSMHDLDPFMFDELAQQNKRNNSQTNQVADDQLNQLHKFWAQVARTAAKRDKNVNLARVLADIQVQFSKPPEANTPTVKKAQPIQLQSVQSKPVLLSPKPNIYKPY